MVSPSAQTFPVDGGDAGQTLAAFLRRRHPEASWSTVKQWIDGRRAQIDGEICRDSARRLKEAQTVTLTASPPTERRHPELVIRYVDGHVVVAEKPSGVCTVRHPSERDWSARRKALHPALEDLLPAILARRESRARKGRPPRLRIVHRLDKETSGLVAFARTPQAEIGLGRQFRRHTVIRRYFAVIPGTLPSQRIESRLIRDRGDGRRGSTPLEEHGKTAITHVELIEQLPGYSLMACKLETGRTHQIRIHLSEAGHPVCGEKVYNRRPGEPVRVDRSGAPRLALHATELGFVHPITQEVLHWQMPLPADLAGWLATLRAGGHVR